MSIPSRHSEKAVERYEPFIKAVSQNYPNPIVIDPDPLSSDTFACRFRDAVAGIMRYKVRPDLYDEVSVWAGDYTVAVVKGSNQLAIGKTANVKAAMKPDAPVGRVLDASIAPMGTVETPSDSIINAILVLMEANILEHCTLRNADEESLRARLAKCTKPIEIVSQEGLITLF